MKDEILQCCELPLGTLEPGGNWIKYPNPLVCSKCGTNRDRELREHILNACSGSKRRAKGRTCGSAG